MATIDLRQQGGGRYDLEEVEEDPISEVSDSEEAAAAGAVSRRQEHPQRLQ